MCAYVGTAARVELHDRHGSMGFRRVQVTLCGDESSGTTAERRSAGVEMAVASDLPHAVCVELARQSRRAPMDTRQRRNERARAISSRSSAGDQRHRRDAAHQPRSRPFAARNAGAGAEYRVRSHVRRARVTLKRPAGGLFAMLCGAEAAMVVNNNASAVLLVLAALADRATLVSRGESVEIGGGFRVPEVMEQSGARLVDVGTTNRTRSSPITRRPVDAAQSDKVAVVLKVHPSNYRIDGFVESTSVAQLATLGVPVVADIGSGLIDANCPWLPGRRLRAGQRTGCSTNTRRRGGARHVQRRQAARRAAGGHHRRSRRSRRSVHAASTRPSTSPGRPRVGRSAAHRPRLPRQDRRRTPSRSGRWWPRPLYELRTRADEIIIAAGGRRDRATEARSRELARRLAPALLPSASAWPAIDWPCCGRRTHRSSPALVTGGPCSICAPSTPAAMTPSRQPCDDARSRHRRSRRPRQVVAGRGAHRHQPRSFRGRTQPRADHRPRLRPHHPPAAPASASSTCPVT